MKHRYIIVLATTAAEAHQYARRADIARFSYRVPASASSIRGLQSADVHVLPGFNTRRDRHSILAELRWGRDIKMMDVEMPQVAPVDQGDGMGEQMTIDEAMNDLAELQRRMSPEGQAATTAGAVVEIAELLDDPQGRVEIMQAMSDEIDDTLEEPRGEETGTTEPSEDAAPAPQSEPRRRRSRCAKCGTLHFPAEPCDPTVETAGFL